MPGYYVHLAATNQVARRNNSFLRGVEMPDLLKTYLKRYGLVKTRKKYNELKTPDMPDFSFYEKRVQEKDNDLENGDRYTWDNFFTIFSDKYEYQVQEFFDEKVKTIDVKLSLLDASDEYSIYSMDISYDDVSERYLNGSIDRYNIGAFMICKDSIYLLYDYQDDTVPSKDDFLEKGIRFEGGEDQERNIDGIIVTYNYCGEWAIPTQDSS